MSLKITNFASLNTNMVQLRSMGVRNIKASIRTLSAGIIKQCIPQNTKATISFEAGRLRISSESKNSALKSSEELANGALEMGLTSFEITRPLSLNNAVNELSTLLACVIARDSQALSALEATFDQIENINLDVPQTSLVRASDQTSEALAVLQTFQDFALGTTGGIGIVNDQSDGITIINNDEQVGLLIQRLYTNPNKLEILGLINALRFNGMRPELVTALTNAMIRLCVETTDIEVKAKCIEILGAKEILDRGIAEDIICMLTSDNDSRKDAGLRRIGKNCPEDLKGFVIRLTMQALKLEEEIATVPSYVECLRLLTADSEKINDKEKEMIVASILEKIHTPTQYIGNARDIQNSFLANFKKPFLEICANFGYPAFVVIAREYPNHRPAMKIHLIAVADRALKKVPEEIRTPLLRAQGKLRKSKEQTSPPDVSQVEKEILSLEEKITSIDHFALLLIAELSNSKIPLKLKKSILKAGFFTTCGLPIETMQALGKALTDNLAAGFSETSRGEYAEFYAAVYTKLGEVPAVMVQEITARYKDSDQAVRARMIIALGQNLARIPQAGSIDELMAAWVEENKFAESLTILPMPIVKALLHTDILIRFSPKEYVQRLIDMARLDYKHDMSYKAAELLKHEAGFVIVLTGMEALQQIPLALRLEITVNLAADIKNNEYLESLQQRFIQVAPLIKNREKLLDHWLSFMANGLTNPNEEIYKRCWDSKVWELSNFPELKTKYLSHLAQEFHNAEIAVKRNTGRIKTLTTGEETEKTKAERRQLRKETRELKIIMSTISSVLMPLNWADILKSLEPGVKDLIKKAAGYNIANMQVEGSGPKPRI